MCIRDSVTHRADAQNVAGDNGQHRPRRTEERGDEVEQHRACLLYTSDAADERSSVDLGGRRIIKKTKKYEIHGESNCIIK